MFLRVLRFQLVSGKLVVRVIEAVDAKYGGLIKSFSNVINSSITRLS